jgi:hypothetical protein
MPDAFFVGAYSFAARLDQRPDDIHGMECVIQYASGGS